MSKQNYCKHDYFRKNNKILSTFHSLAKKTTVYIKTAVTAIKPDDLDKKKNRKRCKLQICCNIRKYYVEISPIQLAV